MPRFERLEFPKKYSIPGGIKLGVLLLIAIGIWIQTCSDKQLHREVIISDVKITDYSKVHVEVQYVIQNMSGLDREVKLLLRIYDEKGVELGSTLFLVNLEAGKKQSMLKIIDKLSRPLEKDEKPFKATINLYTKKVI